jgi:hypothetical protein
MISSVMCHRTGFVIATRSAVRHEVGEVARVCEFVTEEELAVGKRPKVLFWEAMREYMKGYVKGYREEEPTGEIPPPP